MKFLQRLLTATAILCCGVSLCLGLTALSDGTFQKHLTDWPNAQAQENGKNADGKTISFSDAAPEPESEDCFPEDPLLADAEAVVPLSTQEPESAAAEEPFVEDVTPTPAPMSLPEDAGELVVYRWETRIPTPRPAAYYTYSSPVEVEVVLATPGPTTEAAAILSDFAERAHPMATEEASILLQDSIQISNADAPDAFSVLQENAQALFRALRRAYGLFTGISVPEEGYVCSVVYDSEEGTVEASWEPADRTLRQINGEAEILAYRIRMDYSVISTGEAAEPRLYFSMQGFRLAPGQIGEKLRGDVEHLAAERGFPDNWVITGLRAGDVQSGLLEYVVEDALDSQHTLSLIYDVPDFQADQVESVKKELLDAWMQVIHSCRVFTPVRHDLDGKVDYLVNLDLLPGTLSAALGRQVQFTANRDLLNWDKTRAALAMLETGPAEFMEVNIPFSDLPDFLKTPLRRVCTAAGMTDEVMSTCNLDYLTIDQAGGVFAWVGDTALYLGDTEMAEGLTMALELDGP